VIGAGAVGLTTAISLAEAGLSVTIRTAVLPAQTTSVAAGAVWGAVKVGPPDRVLGWGRTGLEVLSKLAAEPGTGVRMAAGREVSRGPRGVPRQPGPRTAVDRVHVPARGHHPARRHERRGELGHGPEARSSRTGRGRVRRHRTSAARGGDPRPPRRPAAVAARGAAG